MTAVAEVVGRTEMRAAADAEEKKSDCGKAAVSSGELGSSQNPMGQTDCLWKLWVKVGAARQEDLGSFGNHPSPYSDYGWLRKRSSFCVHVAIETVNNPGELAKDLVEKRRALTCPVLLDSEYLAADLPRPLAHRLHTHAPSINLAQGSGYMCEHNQNCLM